MTRAQLAALDHVRALSSGKVGPGLAPSVIERHGRVGLNFHPDRLLRDGRTVAQALLADGIYRSQFETGISNGSRSAFPGGSRAQWEDRLFGSCYEVAAERPKYGALNLMHHRDGPAPRFGSCHFRLRSTVLERCTFCFGDSHVGPTAIGTIDTFEPVLAALFEAVETTGQALGVDAVDIPLLVAMLETPPRWSANGRALDHYIEAQVHGDVVIARDAEALVVDPSFIGTETGAVLERIAHDCGLELGWHAGFVLPFHQVPDNFRGPAMPLLARRIEREHGGELLHAASLGQAAASLVSDPARWTDWGPFDETLQHIKQLWHVLVRHGSPLLKPGAVQPI